MGCTKLRVIYQLKTTRGCVVGGSPMPLPMPLKPKCNIISNSFIGFLLRFLRHRTSDLITCKQGNISNMATWDFPCTPIFFF